ncbi:MAG: serine/threonine-protein kinase [Gemmatimonadaceae bacterium]|nr:serine/threonine-protein kinase [Gemmatimonadaceae bacterium]
MAPSSADDLDRLRAALAPAGYDIEAMIGRGGMASVYRARDRRHQRRVALKLLHADLALGHGTARFLREVEICGRLTHPNIVPLLDSGAIDRQPWFTMPFVEGETLRARTDREHRVPVAFLVAIARDTADALHYAHAAGIVHRDIKPENLVLVGERAMVLDFGIGRAIAVADEVEPRMTSVGLVMGTPLYMAPEQAANDARLDGRTDQYALALVLWEALVGEHPFRASSVSATISRRFSETPPRVDQVRPDVPAPLAAAIARALRIDPDARFPTAAEFADALQDALTTRSVIPAPEVPSIAVLPFANVGGESANAFLADGLTDEIISGLSRLRTLRVTARSSTYALRGTDADLRTVGQRLAVDTVLEGSVQRAGDRVRVSARLVQVADGVQRWASQFDRRFDDLFSGPPLPRHRATRTSATSRGATRGTRARRMD